jgi:hypothetical protein
MCVHLWPEPFIGEPGAAPFIGGFVAVGVEDAAAVVTERGEPARPAAPVEALAMVRPRARLAPSAAAATAVPMSGRLIRTVLLPTGRASGAVRPRGWAWTAYPRYWAIRNSVLNGPHLSATAEHQDFASERFQPAGPVQMARAASMVSASVPYPSSARLDCHH